MEICTALSDNSPLSTVRFLACQQAVNILDFLLQQKATNLSVGICIFKSNLDFEKKNCLISIFIAKYFFFSWFKVMNLLHSSLTFSLIYFKILCHTFLSKLVLFRLGHKTPLQCVLFCQSTATIRTISYFLIF